MWFVFALSSLSKAVYGFLKFKTCFDLSIPFRSFSLSLTPFPCFTLSFPSLSLSLSLSMSFCLSLFLSLCHQPIILYFLHSLYLSLPLFTPSNSFSPFLHHPSTPPLSLSVCLSLSLSLSLCLSLSLTLSHPFLSLLNIRNMVLHGHHKAWRRPPHSAPDISLCKLSSGL